MEDMVSSFKLTKSLLEKLIAEAIRDLLLEVKFNPAELSKFANFEQMLGFVEQQGLRYISKGSSRMVFVLDSKRALKVAMNSKGLAQNQGEIQVSHDPASFNLVARVLSSDPEGKWITSELVRPITGYKEFRQLTGVDFEFFVAILMTPQQQRLANIANFRKKIAAGQFRYIAQTPEEFDKVVTTTFFTSALSVLDNLKVQLEVGDLGKISSWGKTADQRAVILDYGLTTGDYERLYR